MPSFDFHEWSRTRRDSIEFSFNTYLSDLTEAPPALVEAIAYSLTAGGKRLRPLLCHAWAETFGLPTSRSSLLDDVACAIECIHTYSLIHDDLPAMDNSDLRRGRPSSHKQFGEATAILAGDALLTDAFWLLSKHDSPSADELKVRAQLVSELARAAGSQGMVGGQLIDLAQEFVKTEEQLRALHRMKTGALILASCRMGAIAANVPVNELSWVSRYGAAVGLAFQMTDDVLDVTSKPETLGKPTLVDAKHAKVTFPVLFGLEKTKSMAEAQVAEALACAERFEVSPGPLSALARMAVERSS